MKITWELEPPPANRVNEADCATECATEHPRRHPLDCRPFDRSEVNEARFWAKVDKDGPVPLTRPELGPCWLWIGAKNLRGYGSIGINCRTLLAHRVSVVLDGREIPEGMLADHLCRNSSCVNPRHIRVATPKQNGENTAEAEKTHCHRGHEFTAENTFLKRGSRQCRKCRAIYQRNFRSRAKLLEVAQ